MNNNRKMKPFDKLDLKDRFLFEQVSDDPECCQAMLEIIFDREIPVLMKNITEKELRWTPNHRGIRMDVFAADLDETIYNLEMQQKNVGNLAKRGRYYQAHIDVTLLEPGDVDFSKLNDSYFIMISCFDIFGLGKYRYTCRMTCDEVPGAVLQDGAVRIFLNTKGTEQDGITPELIEFLKYVEDSTDIVCNESNSSRIHKIHSRVKTIKQNEEMGVRYMQEWEERIILKQEAMEEGREEGKKQGREQGREEMAITIARSLLNILDVKTIAKTTGLPIEVIENLSEDE